MACWKLMFWVEEAFPLPFAQIPSQRIAGAKVMDLIGISDMTYAAVLEELKFKSLLNAFLSNEKVFEFSDDGFMEVCRCKFVFPHRAP